MKYSLDAAWRAVETIRPGSLQLKAAGYVNLTDELKACAVSILIEGCQERWEWKKAKLIVRTLLLELREDGIMTFGEQEFDELCGQGI